MVSTISKLQAFLQEHNMSYLEFTKLSGLSSGHVHKLVSGEIKAPRVPTLVKIERTMDEYGEGLEDGIMAFFGMTQEEFEADYEDFVKQCEALRAKRRRIRKLTWLLAVSVLILIATYVWTHL